MANVFPIVRPTTSGAGADLAETDVLLLGNMDRSTAGNLSIGTATATTVTIGHAGANLDIDGNAVDIDAAGAFSIDGATASNVTVSGAAADLTLGARAATITLNEAGQTTLSGGFTATSIVGALNELLATVGVSTDLDEGYNNFGANPAIVTIDNAQGQGDLRWKPTGNRNFIVDTSAANNFFGFGVLDGTDHFTLLHMGANLLDLSADLQDVDIDTSAGIALDAATASNFTVTGAAADLTLGARAATITLNEAGDTTLSGFTATSIIGALNELNSAAAAVDLDDAYNNFGAVPATVVVDNAEGQGDVTWDLNGAFSFNVDLLNTTGTADGFQVYDGVSTEYWRLIRKADNIIDLEAEIRNVDYNVSGYISLDAVAASNFTVSGATADLTLGARAATITLNEAGQTTLNPAFTATSIIGALNELVSGPGITTDLNDAYDNFGANPATIVVDNAEGQGDLTVDLTGAFSFIVDLSNITGTSDGFAVLNGSQMFTLTYKGANLIDLYAQLQQADYGHTADATWVPTGAASFRVNLLNVTGTADGLSVFNGTDQFDLIRKGANLMDLDADLQVVEVDASVGISLDAVEASNFTVSGAAADLTFGARAATITLNEAGDTTLSGFTATSIVGALNELKTGVGNVTLDQAYDNDGGAASITVDAGDVSWDLTGAFSFNVDLASATGTADGFQVLDGTDHFKILHQGLNSANLDADLNDITMDAAAGISLDANAASNFSTVNSNLTLSTVTSGNVIVNAAGTTDIDGANVTIDASSAVSIGAAAASDFTVTGATADLTLGARAATITLNEAGDTTLSGFTATSIIGALNELNTGLGNVTLDQAYNNDGGAASITVDVGDVTWNLTGAYSFIVDASAATGTVDGFYVNNGTDYLAVVRTGVNTIDLGLECDQIVVAHTSDSSWFPVGVTSVIYNLSLVTGTADGFSVVNGTDQFDLIYKGANLLDLDADLQEVGINASGSVDIDATNVYVDATASISLDGVTSSNFTITGDSATLTLKSDGGPVVIDAGMNVDIDAAQGLTMDAANVSIDATGASNFTVSGATADLTLGARAATITLNEAGDTTLSGFTATSIIGALNELKAGVGVSTDLDEAYNNFGANPATIVVDNAQGQGDVTWDLTGAFSFNVDLANATGTADGFQVVDGTDHFKILHQGANSANLDADLNDIAFDAAAGISLDAATASNFTISGASADLTLGARAATITLNEAGDTALSGFTATSIIGALNELKSSMATCDLDCGYDNFGATPATVTIDNAEGQGDLTWNVSGAFSFVVGLSSATGTADGFQVVDGTDHFKILHQGANSANLDADLNDVTFDAAAGISLDAATASNFTVSGATADLTLGARAATITLNEAGDTSLDPDFTATSIVGALNELVGVVGLPSGVTGWRFSTTITDSDPGSGYFRLNNATQPSSTYLYVDDISVLGPDMSEMLLALNTGDRIYIQQLPPLSGRYHVVELTGDPIDGTGTYVKLPITVEDSGSDLQNNKVCVWSFYSAALVTLDVAYNNDAGAADITVDAGDVTWDLTGAYSFNVDLAAATGTADGFSVVDGTDQFNLTHKGANLMDLDADLQVVEVDASSGISLDAATASNFTVSGASADLTLGARATTITLNEAGDTSLSGFTATSIIGALNELKGEIGVSTDLDEAYNNFGANPATIVVDNAESQGDVTWDLTGAFSFNVDLANTTGTADGFQVYDGISTEYFKLLRTADNAIKLDAALDVVDIAHSSDATWSPTGATSFTVDLTGCTGTSDGFAVLNGSQMFTLTYRGANLVDLYAQLQQADYGHTADATWVPTGAASFNVNLANVTGTVDGVSVFNGTDQFDLIRKGINLIDLDADLQQVDIDASSGISLDSNAASNFTVDSANLTLATTTSGNVILNSDGYITFEDQYKAGSTYATDLVLSDASGEWDTFETNFGEVSILNAINQAYGAGSNPTLDDAYNNDSGERTITVDNGDVSWDLTGAYSFIIDASGATGTADGFSVVDGTDQFNLTHKGANLLDLDADLQTVEIDASGGISLDAATASNFTVSGASADLTLGARGQTITLNESGETSLDATFDATSIIGALNELRDEETFALSGGRSSTITNQYLRGPDRVPMNLAGFVLPWDATITGIGAATTGAQSWTAEVRKNDSATVIASLVVSAAARASTGVLSVNVNAGDELQFYCNGTSIITPMMTVYLRRR